MLLLGLALASPVDHARAALATQRPHTLVFDKESTGEVALEVTYTGPREASAVAHSPDGTYSVSVDATHMRLRLDDGSCASLDARTLFAEARRAALDPSTEPPGSQLIYRVQPDGTLDPDDFTRDEWNQYCPDISYRPSLRRCETLEAQDLTNAALNALLPLKYGHDLAIDGDDVIGLIDEVEVSGRRLHVVGAGGQRLLHRGLPSLRCASDGVGKRCASRQLAFAIDEVQPGLRLQQAAFAAVGVRQHQVCVRGRGRCLQHGAVGIVEDGGASAGDVIT